MIRAAGTCTPRLAGSVFVQTPGPQASPASPEQENIPPRAPASPALSVRLWALDLVLRCPAVTLVVADGSGLSLTATRQLQRAAEAGGTLALLVRPPHERTHLSAAATRWLVRCLPPPTAAAARDGPQPPVRWLVQRLRGPALRISIDDLKLAIARTGRGLLRVTLDPRQLRAGASPTGLRAPAAPSAALRLPQAEHRQLGGGSGKSVHHIP